MHALTRGNFGISLAGIRMSVNLAIQKEQPYIYNIHTSSENIYFICTRCQTGQKCSLFYLFLKLIQIMQDSVCILSLSQNCFI